MTEWRTEEQIKADDALARAIADNLRAYSDDPEDHNKFMLTEYVVISARVGITDEKAQHTKYDYTLSNGSIPWHNMLGLISWAKRTMLANLEGGEDE